MLSCLDGVLLSRQPEAVIPHGVQDIEATMSLVARVDVAGDVAEGVADVEPCAGRVGEHVENVEFGLARVLSHFVGVLFRPNRLPPLLYRSKIVIHRTPCFIGAKVSCYFRSTARTHVFVLHTEYCQSSGFADDLEGSGAR